MESVEFLTFRDNEPRISSNSLSKFKLTEAVSEDAARNILGNRENFVRDAVSDFQPTGFKLFAENFFRTFYANP